MFVFWLKKILTPLFYPLTWLLLALGLLIACLPASRRRLRWWLGAGFLALWLLATPWLANPLLRQLENHSPALQIQPSHQDIVWVVVLGGGVSANPDYPLTSQLSHSTLVRLNEGIILLQQLPKSRLLLSGGALPGRTPEAVLIGKTAQKLGVPAERIVLETDSLDTKDQAQNIASLVGSDAFILVTSAYHMRRTLGLFRTQSLEPLAAPTDFRILPGDKPLPFSLYPTAGNLLKWEILIKEHLGYLWAVLNGQIHKQS